MNKKGVFYIWACIVRKNSLKGKIIATFANIYEQIEWYLLEACEPSRTQLRNVCLPLNALPSTWSTVHLLFDDNLRWGFIVLSSKRIHLFHSILLGTEQASENMVQFFTLFSNRRVHCYEFGQFWQLIFNPKELPLGFLRWWRLWTAR